MAEDKDQKTEEPTQKKLEQAHKKGDVPKSQEINTWFVLAAGALSLAVFANGSAARLTQFGRGYFQQMHDVAIDPGSVMDLAQRIAGEVAGLLAAPMAALAIAALAGNLLQTGLIFSAEKIKPKLSKLSPLKGAQRMFGLEGLVNLGKGLGKMALVGVVIFAIVWPQRDRAALILQWDPHQLAPMARRLALQMFAATLAVLSVLAALDYAYQRYQHMKNQKMSKQEVKDEFKQSDGDPVVKARLRQIRQERAQRRMMAKVPDASVVIANPTHYAVALKYEMGQKGAPVCLAKGVDAVALRIRDVATEHKIPIVENPPLARALFASVDLDEEIPVEHFQAVAKVIGYILKKARKR